MNAIHSQFLHFHAIDALMTQLISGQQQSLDSSQSVLAPKHRSEESVGVVHMRQ